MYANRFEKEREREKTNNNNKMRIEKAQTTSNMYLT